jgi:hypothetical protein
MKRLLVAILLLLVAAVTTHGQTAPTISFWVEAQTQIAEGQVTPQVDGLLSHQYSEKLGISLWFQKSKNYGQVYVGPTYYLAPWIQVGGELGLEQADNPARVAGFVYAAKNRFSFLSVQEYGGSGYWRKYELMATVTKTLSVGIVEQSFDGVGPRVEVKLPKTPILIWGAVLTRDGKATTRVAMRITF